MADRFLLVIANEDLGFRAVFFNPWEEHFRADLPELDPLMQQAQDFGRPVIVAAGYPWVSEALQIAALARRWPQVDIVMTNGGQINISGLGQADAALALAQNSRLYFDTTGIYRQDFIEETVETFGAGRVLFASGAPDFDPCYELKRVMKAKVDEAQRLAMRSGNAQRLLKFPATKNFPPTA